MEQSLLSVGIDLGTSTTQLIFSRIYLTDAAMCAVPDIKITKKEIIYRSAIHFTPLLNRQEIDLPAVEDIIRHEYERAGVTKDDIETGAVIITGETARKENAEKVLQQLSAFAGDFVVATAGPDLESVLAGFGSGAAERSKHVDGDVVNFDIGGGTTNAAVFVNGQVRETFALDIGGRLIHVDDHKITYVSKRLTPLLEEMGISLHPGDEGDFNTLRRVTDAFATVLVKLFRGNELTAGEASLGITALPQEGWHGEPTFSGGVGECVYTAEPVETIEEAAKFGDIGPLLGQSIRQAFGTALLTDVPAERIRATVIGAGSHSLHISGSTVYIDEAVLPLKNIPVVAVQGLSDTAGQQKLQLFPDSLVAIALQEERSPSYGKVKELAKKLAAMLQYYIQRQQIVIILLDADFAKALGMTLQALIPEKKIICVDNITAHDGDYVDIGRPVSSVVPVVVKTLIFKA